MDFSKIRIRPAWLWSVAALVLAGLYVGGSVLLSQRVPDVAVPVRDDAVVGLRVRLGVADAAPRSWDGEVTANNGEILSIRDWRPRKGDQISGTRSWTLATQKGPVFPFRPTDADRQAPPPHNLLIPGLILEVRTAGATELNFRTKGGDFAFRPSEIPNGKPLSLLSGSVLVDRVPVAQEISSRQFQNESAAVLAGDPGQVWTAWVGYREKGDQVLVRRRNGAHWEATESVTEKPGEVFLVKLGRDGRGGVWAVWSAEVNQNFDLYGRRFDGKSWSAVERLTDDPEPDIYHNLATDSHGNLWLVWQGFRNGRSDIFARRFDGNTWTPAERVSDSPANDWEPAVAADRRGNVYVAWDTYDKGNYDVRLRRFANGAWQQTAAIAETPRFEAHVSLACDAENRLWATWNESGFEWGKDYGFLVRKGGTGLYQWRSVGVAVYDGTAWREPSPIEDSLPAEFAGYNDYPTLLSDPAGRVWLFFRHRTLDRPDTPSGASAHLAAWEIYGSYYASDHWTAPVAFPESRGRTDMRAGFAPGPEGQIYAAWPTDSRDFRSYLFQRADVYFGSLPGAGGPAPTPRLNVREPVEYHATVVHPGEVADLERIRNYQIEANGKTYHIYRGDTHRHTEFSNSDGNNDGALAETYRYAIDAASLDYLAVTDHNGQGGPDIDYINWLMQREAEVFWLPARFTPMFSYERSVRYPNGHRNVIFAQKGNPTLPIPESEEEGKTGAEQLYQYLKQRHGISIPHTSATNMGTDWRDNDPQVEPLVEIYQGDRISSEYEGAPKAANRDEPASAPGGFKPKGYVWNAWAKGYKLGVQASSDHISTHISYACTIATDFTREGLLDAMRQRHSYGATDNIILDYRAEANGRSYLQGDIVEVRGAFQLRVKVIGTADIRQIDIIKNNRFIYNSQPLVRNVDFTYTDGHPDSGESYYYVRVIQANDQMAWSSPIWIKR